MMLLPWWWSWMRLDCRGRVGPVVRRPARRDVERRPRATRRARMPGRTNARTRRRASVGVGEVDAVGGAQQVRQHDARRPLGHPLGLGRVEPAGEERGGEGARHGQDLVDAGEGQVRQHRSRARGRAGRPARRGRVTRVAASTMPATRTSSRSVASPMRTARARRTGPPRCRRRRARMPSLPPGKTR